MTLLRSQSGFSIQHRLGSCAVFLLLLTGGVGSSGTARAAGSGLLGDLLPVNQFVPSTSYSATTGLIRIPSGEVQQQGVFALHYDTFWDRRFSGRTQDGYDAGMVIGLLPNLELSGRLANYGRSGEPSMGSNSRGWDPLVIRDLSANFKYRLPQVFKWQPAIALGATDVGGAASNFQSVYAAATQAFGPLQLTMGYGRGPDQFNGVFGGVQLGLIQAGSSLVSLIAEDDSRDRYVGIRYVSPGLAALNGLQLVGTLSRSLRSHNELGLPNDRTEASLVLRIPLEKPARRVAMQADSTPYVAMPVPGSAVSASSLAAASDRSPSISTMPSTPGEQLKASTSAKEATGSKESERSVLSMQDLGRLADQLVAAGLDHVRVGLAGAGRQVLVARIDGSLFARNDLDAIGIALGVLAEGTEPASISELVIVQERAAQPIYQVRVNRDAWLGYLRGGNAAAVLASLRSQTHTSFDDDQVSWHGEPRRVDKLRLTLGLRYAAYYGTEVATLDYSTGLASSAYLPVWKGAELSATIVDQLYKTQNFRYGGVFSGTAVRSGLSSVALNQTWWLGKRLLNLTSIGQFFYDYRGLQHESVMFLPWRDDAIRARFTRTELADSSLGLAGRKDSSQLGYRLQLPNLDSSLELNYNRYLSGDRGLSLDFKRFFGDVMIGLTLRDSDRARFAGLTLGIPLAPQRGWRSGIGFSLNGEPQFHTSVLSRIGESHNQVRANGVVVTPFEYNLSGMLLNRDRMHQSFISGRIDHLRSVYLKMQTQSVSKP